MTQYTLTVQNKSTLAGSICVYQRNPSQKRNDGLFSLAWLSKACIPETTVKFHWGIDYGFVWGETGELAPGVYFDASEVKAADPADASRNAIGFSRLHGAYHFTPPPALPVPAPWTSKLMGLFLSETLPSA